MINVALLNMGQALEENTTLKYLSLFGNEVSHIYIYIILILYNTNDRILWHLYNHIFSLMKILVKYFMIIYDKPINIMDKK